MASNSDISGKSNQIVCPFEVPVPNSVPVSVTTPQGGTTYQLTAELTASSNSGSGGSNHASRGSNLLVSLLSAAAAARSSSVVVTTLTVRIHRAGFMRSLCRWRCSRRHSACNGGGRCDNVEV
ncbi:hypothetical protein BG011_005075 [Mortierella polycephala]|uniref:Uncharacterized protein n=1 Tax=Mortierella polycephala TaxID=41804 RepID=A0A9P6PZ63_9FUNG|nr:hypothetical protein BG011_005075 [Mortierella polycephala]